MLNRKRQLVNVSQRSLTESVGLGEERGEGGGGEEEGEEGAEVEEEGDGRGRKGGRGGGQGARAGGGFCTGGRAGAGDHYCEAAGDGSRIGENLKGLEDETTSSFLMTKVKIINNVTTRNYEWLCGDWK